uniref:Putative ovule protein n=1 Tax=Solanum chacoense TaxID=4108 RepID=A0A0V0GIT1_SOLCH
MLILTVVDSVFCSSPHGERFLCFDRDCFLATRILSQLCFSCMSDSFNSCPLVDFFVCMFELPTFCCPGVINLFLPIVERFR